MKKVCYNKFMKQNYKKAAILKLKTIVKQGYIPSREGESYLFADQITNPAVTKLANCFEHACFNLPNLKLAEFSYQETKLFDLRDFQFQSEEQIAKNFTNLLKKCGLKVERLKKEVIIKDNQWIVALYFGNNGSIMNVDFHFLRQEKDGRWSSKHGWGGDVEYFDSLPTQIEHNDWIYKLYERYIITNPYAQKISEDASESSLENHAI